MSRVGDVSRSSSRKASDDNLDLKIQTTVYKQLLSKQPFLLRLGPLHKEWQKHKEWLSGEQMLIHGCSMDWLPGKMGPFGPQGMIKGPKALCLHQ